MPAAPTISATASAPTILGVLLGATSSGLTVWKEPRPAPLPTGSCCKDMGRSSDELKSRKDMHSSWGVVVSLVRERDGGAGVACGWNKGKLRRDCARAPQSCDKA